MSKILKFTSYDFILPRLLRPSHWNKKEASVGYYRDIPWLVKWHQELFVWCHKLLIKCYATENTTIINKLQPTMVNGSNKIICILVWYIVYITNGLSLWCLLSIPLHQNSKPIIYTINHLLVNYFLNLHLWFLSIHNANMIHHAKKV